MGRKEPGFVGREGSGFDGREGAASVGDEAPISSSVTANRAPAVVTKSAQDASPIITAKTRPFDRRNFFPPMEIMRGPFAD